jgi:hypothetical protein
MNEAAGATGAACEFDHLIVGAHTLEQGAAYIENLLGVKPQAGGRHLAMGTHNLVLRLGARAFLEVISIDPAGEKPPRPRWFGLDEERTRLQLRERPRLLTWAARTRDIGFVVKNGPAALGTVHPMSRGTYTWRITIPGDGALVCDGLLPAFIRWDGDAHPADRLDDRGCDLVKLDGFCSSPGDIAPTLAKLGLKQTISLTRADHAQLVATILGPRGFRTITS